MDKIYQPDSDVKFAGATRSTNLLAGQPSGQNLPFSAAATRITATDASAGAICAAEQIETTLAAFTFPARRLFTRFVPAWQQADVSQAVGAAIAALQVIGEVETTIPDTPFEMRVVLAGTRWQVIDFYKGCLAN